jgi:hypothetical protein
MAMAFAIPLQKTHELSFEPRQVCYPWHRWYGQTILTRRAGGAHADVAYFCKLPDAPLDAMLVEIPKWMLDAALCAPMRLVDDPHVDCATLRTLKSAISEQRFSLNAGVLQPQVSRQAGDGDADDTSPCTSNYSTGAVRRAGRRAELERSQRADAERCSKAARSTPPKCSDKKANPQSKKKRRVR